MAKHTNITHLIDTRWQGMAKGVGTSRIVGRVHMAPIAIGGQSYPCSFTILENNDMDFLLGLDMLKAHQAIIDLRANVLRIGETATPFLGESEIPKQSVAGTPTIGSNSEASSGSGAAASTSGDRETAIAQLLGLGAQSPEHAAQLLDSAGGNLEAAAGL